MQDIPSDKENTLVAFTYAAGVDDGGAVFEYYRLDGEVERTPLEPGQVLNFRLDQGECIALLYVSKNHVVARELPSPTDETGDER